jgi:hypothetical protein
MRRLTSLEFNHQLESRVREIRLPGSEARGEALLRPYPYLKTSIDQNSLTPSTK